MLWGVRPRMLSRQGVPCPSSNYLPHIRDFGLIGMIGSGTGFGLVWLA